MLPYDPYESLHNPYESLHNPYESLHKPYWFTQPRYGFFHDRMLQSQSSDFQFITDSVSSQIARIIRAKSDIIRSLGYISELSIRRSNWLEDPKTLPLLLDRAAKKSAELWTDDQHEARRKTTPLLAEAQRCAPTTNHRPQRDTRPLDEGSQ